MHETCFALCMPRRRHLVLFLAIFFLTRFNPAQNSAKTPTIPTPAYDVVSIVPHKFDAESTSWGSQGSTFTATNLTVKMFVTLAFGLRQNLISGLPAWADSNRYDIKAKIVDADFSTLRKLTDKQHNEMLVKILTDRFNLKSHTETKELPVYNLVLAHHGSKLKTSAIQDNSKGTWTSNTGDFTGTTISITSLTDMLANELHRTVIDKTNLSALYDMHLTWAPDPLATVGQDNGRVEDAGPSIFSALQDQLGLKLVPTKGPVTTLVIDHVERPTPN
jgi:uncharacterized protein (TIGR03435 family)